MDDKRAAEAKRLADEYIASMQRKLDAGPSARRLASGSPETGYESELTRGAEKAYEKKTGTDQLGSGPDYDLRGAHAAGLLDSNAPMHRLPTGELVFPNHLPDTFKKPNHPTFSEESQYAKDEPNLAGHWEDNDRFIQNKDAPPSWLKDYMTYPAEYEKKPEEAAPLGEPDWGPDPRYTAPMTGDENWGPTDDDAPVASLFDKKVGRRHV